MMIQINHQIQVIHQRKIVTLQMKQQLTQQVYLYLVQYTHYQTQWIIVFLSQTLR